MSDPLDTHPIRDGFLQNGTNFILEVAYDGSCYLGWQKTHCGPSIEQEIEAALYKILQHPISLQAASRTDRGVHAIGQIINFYTPKDIDLKRTLISLNQLLPSTISVFKLSKAPYPQFHPTLDAVSKEYHYHIYNRQFHHPLYRSTHWHVHAILNIINMQQAAALLTGCHDFSSFCNSRKQMHYAHKVRDLEKLDIIQLDGYRLKIVLKGNQFLYKMARNLVGFLVYIGSGKISVEEIPSILANKSRKHLGITAPAHGLVLDQVFYPFAIFDNDKSLPPKE